MALFSSSPLNNENPRPPCEQAQRGKPEPSHRHWEQVTSSPVHAKTSRDPRCNENSKQLSSGEAAQAKGPHDLFPKWMVMKINQDKHQLESFIYLSELCSTYRKKQANKSSHGAYSFSQFSEIVIFFFW